MQLCNVASRAAGAGGLFFCNIIEKVALRFYNMVAFLLLHYMRGESALQVAWIWCILKYRKSMGLQGAHGGAKSVFPQPNPVEASG